MTNSSNAVSLSVTVNAPAKINLILRILDRRSDGYHNVWSIMQTVALQDEIRITRSSTHCDIRLMCDDRQLGADRSNLVYKAAAAVLEKAQLMTGLDIELRKRIPMGAGLGGGSSDAAATIVGLNRLLQLGWSQFRMAEVAQPLGSDVPFFLYAPTASVAGRGDVVIPLGIVGRKWVLLANPGFGVETKWAYHELASTRGSVRPLTPVHRELDRGEPLQWGAVCRAAENDFEAPVYAKHPVLDQMKQALLEQGAEMALLSGSGATVFGLFDTEAAARQAAVCLAGPEALKVFVVPTCSTPLLCADSDQIG